VKDQSSESRRIHGPYAVCAPGATTRVDEWPLPETAWLEPSEAPPSSNGPTALRGDALARTLAALR